MSLHNWPIPGEDLAYPPIHFGQDFETWNPDEYNNADMMAYTGQNEWHSVYTIQLGELVESGVFDWNKSILAWEDSAFDERQYNRVCTYFIERFRFREISIVPFYEWATTLRRKLVFELMPKYKPLYEAFEAGINPLSEKDEYHKRRDIQSDYPETLLSGNADYISSGNDIEYETAITGFVAEAETNYIEKFRSIDEALLDELECMFIGSYSTYVNGL